MTEPTSTPSECLRTIEHEGEKILVIDFRRCAGEELERRIATAASVIRSSPEHSLLTMTLFRGLTYNKNTMTVLTEYAKMNAPFVQVGAAVGLEHLSMVVSPVNRLTGRKIRTFDDEESAKEFLVTEKRRMEAETSPSPVQNETVRWAEHDGERILVIDFSNCDTEELRVRVQKVASVIHGEPPQSIVALNLLQNFPFGRETHGTIIEFVKSNRPYVIAAAAVGLGYMKAAIPVLNRFTGRNIRAFDDPEIARNWLVSEKRRFTTD